MTKNHRFSLQVQIVLAIVIGCLAGIFFGPKADVLGVAGTLIVKILRAFATPLVFFAIVDAIISTSFEVKQGLKLLFYSARNGLVALVISFSIVRLFPVGKYMDLSVLSQALLGNPKQPPAPHFVFLDWLAPNVLFVIGLALIVGFGARRISQKNNSVAYFFSRVLKGLITALGWIIKLIPVAIFCVIAKLVGVTGFKFFEALGLFVLLVSSSIFIHIFIYYSFLIWASLKKSPLKFFREASPALLTAFGTGSSLATLPVTLETLEKMNISKGSSRLSACIGTNINHDGILLYEVTAAFFVVQIQSQTLNLSQQLTIASSSILASVGIAGVPEAGLITLSLVLTAAHLPLTALPFLLPVDWFLGRLRALANVSSDMIVAHLLDR